ncbi:MAG: glycosyl hydrolase [Chloroflexota bacterium]
MASEVTPNPAILTASRWRSIGPFRGGRVVAVTGHPSELGTFYFGACAGGIWRTTDGGTYWENVSDGQLGSPSIGAIHLSEADPNVIYAGTGESCIRGNVVHGDGVYGTTNGGKTWANLGLRGTRYIGKVRPHPSNPDTVYVAALGDIYRSTSERGVFRSLNGGKSWEQVLFQSDGAGAVDLSIDATNPRRIFTSLWEVSRVPWALRSGGGGSGLYRSEDGGTAWADITANKGLPGGPWGRVGVVTSPAKSGRVWAIIEAEGGGLFRSDDGGDTWELLNADRSLRLRPWYYNHVIADPVDPDTVYIMNVQAWRSIDGGKTFTEVTTPHGDNHDLWIDPRNPSRMVQGNDGGACVSYNGGDSWSTIYNQPTSQFYHLAVDNQFPYRVYGTQQDNSAISVPSRSNKGAITWHDCYSVGSSESGHIVVDPRDANIVYSGAIGSAPGGGGILLRYDHRSLQTRIITVWPELYGGWGPKDLKYRFQWTFPIVFSPHDPNTLYCTGNRVFRTRDEGTSWETISPDLTRNDESKLGPSGGIVTRDTTGAEHYCTIFAFVESPHERGVLWAGSDDGLVHLSRDDGNTWSNVTPPTLEAWSTVCTIEPSPHDPGTVYLAAIRYKLGDDRPYLYKTTDYGATWMSITRGIAEDDFTRVIRADPARRGLLYAGGERRVYASFDDGASWQPIQGNLPLTPVHDLAVKDGDLVAATHGRGFWILDDLSAIRAADNTSPAEPAVIAPQPAVRSIAPIGAGRPKAPGKSYMVALGYAATWTEERDEQGTVTRLFLDAGPNPPDGALIRYHLPREPEGPITVRFLEDSGTEIISFSSTEPADGKPPAHPRPSARAGLNTFVWNMRYPSATAVPGDVSTERSLSGPLAVPGRYGVQVEVGDRVLTTELEIRQDPRTAATREELVEQHRLLLSLRDKVSETHGAINAMREARQQAEATAKRAGSASPVSEAAATLASRISEIELELVEPRITAPLDMVHYPTRLNARLVALSSVVASADARPTRQSYHVFQDLTARIDEQLRRWRDLLEVDVASLNALARDAGVPTIVV